jgi:hypothetical protein
MNFATVYNALVGQQARTGSRDKLVKAQIRFLFTKSARPAR